METLRSTSLCITFNRTSLELKRVEADYELTLRPLLIEPVWNWNLYVTHSPVCLYLPFNRTSLELKHVWRKDKPRAVVAFNRTSLELKLERSFWKATPCPTLLIEPVWNWNLTITVLKLFDGTSFNRTSLELKHNVIRFYGDKTLVGRLLIEPVWNWNASGCCVCKLSFKYF